MQPNENQLVQHCHCITERMHSTGWIVPPGDGDLANAIAAALRDEEHLDVECPAVEHAPFEEVARDLTPEGFETALRVAETADREETDQPIEHAPHEVPARRLADSARAGRFTGG